MSELLSAEVRRLLSETYERIAKSLYNRCGLDQGLANILAFATIEAVKPDDGSGKA